jgi:hypothetical protein
MSEGYLKPPLMINHFMQALVIDMSNSSQFSGPSAQTRPTPQKTLST